MQSFPPENPERPPESVAPREQEAEPRLLTRRDDGASGQNAARDARDEQLSHSRLRPVHHVQTLAAIRARLTRVREQSARPSAGRKAAVWRKARWFSGFALTLILLVCALVIAFSLALRRDMTTALPQVDGDVHLPGLTAAVVVTRDHLGVPSITAANTSDLLFAQGFVTAQDRLWQMDALRRHGSGELAEILGPSMLSHDTEQRVLQLRAAADRAVLALPPEQLAQLQAYARGINAFIESHPDSLPVEFHLLHYTPAPWTPRDTLLVSLVMFQDLATSYPAKLSREAFSKHVSPELLGDLYPSTSFRDEPPTQPRPDLTTPKLEIQQIPLDQSQVKLQRGHAPPLPLVPLPLATAFDCAECRSGSNDWVVSGAHTQSGKPMLSNDMHLALSVPDIWYEATLHSAGSAPEAPLDVSGFTLPGTPFVIVGRNAHVSWGVTNLLGDVQDVHIEHLRGSGNATEFQQADGSWAPVAHHRELIRVRGGRNRILDVLTTQAHMGGTVLETPIITPLLPGEQRALSLEWTAYDPHNLTSPFGAVNAASSGAALVAAFASFGGPSLNLVYGDDAGHIGYHAVGRIPVRGPAEHHPRAQLQQSLPLNENPAQDDTPEGEPDPGEAPQAQLPASPRLIDAVFAVRRERRSRRANRRGAASAPTRQLNPPRQPAPMEAQAIPAAPVPLEYTIGATIPPVPVDALNRSVQWSGYVPYDELPAVIDPADGVLATANGRVTSDDYPYSLSDMWAPPYRTERIRKLLAGRTGLTSADMLSVQMDSTSAFDRLLAERLAYALDHATDKSSRKDNRRLTQAANILRAWDGNMTPDSAAAAIVTAARPQLLSLLLRAQVAQHDHLSPQDAAVERIVAEYDWIDMTVLLENMLTLQPARWLPAGYAGWNDLLVDSVQRGLASTGAPRDLTRWKYGSLHTIDIEHPVLANALVARMLGVHAGTGAQPIAGDGTTILATGRTFGPSERFTADMADAAGTTANITTGQSGDPRSPHFLDQFPAWLHGTTFPLPLQGAIPQHRMRLLP